MNVCIQYAHTHRIFHSCVKRKLKTESKSEMNAQNTLSYVIRLPTLVLGLLIIFVNNLNGNNNNNDDNFDAKL